LKRVAMPEVITQVDAIVSGHHPPRRRRRT
jgi:hypothetical protein